MTVPSPTPRGDTSPTARADGSLRAAQDAPSHGAALDGSPAAALDVAPVPQRRCLWCTIQLLPGQLRWCSKRCRQTAWRARKLAVIEDPADTPKRLGYADPPFPGLSRKYYRDESTYAGEVDHEALVAQLATYDGWALSTSRKALRRVLWLCPDDVIVCPWVKPIGVSGKTRGAHNSWEPLIVKPARLRRPGMRDWLRAMPARGGGTLPGRKPLAFCRWLFKMLGASPVDTLDDLFPGTGIVGRAFAEFKRVSLRTRYDGPRRKARAAPSPTPAPNDARPVAMGAG